MAKNQEESTRKFNRISFNTSSKQQAVCAVLWLMLLGASALGWLHSEVVFVSTGIGLMLINLVAIGWLNRPQRTAHDGFRSWLASHGYPASRHDTTLLANVHEALMGRNEDLVTHLDQIGNEVDNLAHDVSNSIALTNQGVSHQKKETEKLMHAMSEMLTAAESVSSSAHDASEAANTAEDSAREGQAILHKTTEAINELAQQVEQSSSVIANLAHDSDSIGAILDVIKGVAEQTNLLALNAAIEAARAGEQGRGFAVVADEVRSLASRTHESTSEIESMIQRLQTAAQSASETMSGGQEIAQSSVSQVNQAVSVLDEITASVERIKVMNTQIASAAEEQTAVTQEVKNNVEAIDEVNELTIETLDGLIETGNKMENLGNNIRQIAAAT